MRRNSLLSRRPVPARRPQVRRLSVEAFDDRILPSNVPCTPPPPTDCTPCHACQLPPSQISGMVYVDQNKDGTAQDNEHRLEGVKVVLTGTDLSGNLVPSQTAYTDAGGIYMFQGLPAGNYNIQVVTPTGYIAGQSSVGAFGGTTETGAITNIAIPGGQSSGGYNFGNLEPCPPAPCPPAPCPPVTCPPPKPTPPKPPKCHFDLKDLLHKKICLIKEVVKNCLIKIKDVDCKVKGNNGVGNGLDPQPPGNPPVNDGPGTAPGSPGNKGGAKK